MLRPLQPLQLVQFTLDAEGAKPPQKAYAGDAGYDLYTSQEQVVKAKSFANVHTGVSIAMPDSLWARITGRSSTRWNWGLMVEEAIIDTGYRGEMFAVVWNTTDEDVVVPVGSRLAQIIFHEHVVPVAFVKVEGLPPSERGQKGYGSSGR